MSVPDALREAQLWALRNPAKFWESINSDTTRGTVREPTKAAPTDQDRLSPKYWAPFVLSGDWR